MSRRPDIVLLVLDTQRIDRLSCYGYSRPTSPHLDELAADATLFRRVFATSQWTIPSHASMFTGLYAAEHMTNQSSAALPAGIPTLAERLRDSGYMTAAFCNNPLVGVVNNGLRRGFESFLNYSGLMTSRPNQAGAHPGIISRYRQWFKGRLAETLNRIQDAFARSETMLEFAFTPLMVPLWQTALSFKGNTPKSLNDAARLLIERRGVARNQPIFAFINVMGVHTPYHPDRRMLERFAPEVIRNREAAHYVRRFNSDVFGWLAPFSGVDERYHHVLSDVYDAEVATQDAHIGAFLRRLRESGVLDRTLLLVCADHGDHLGEKGLIGHTVSAYNELVHVPLMVRDPFGDFQRSAVVDHTVSLRRVFHTLLSAAGLASSIERDRSLAQTPTADPEGGAVFVEAEPLQNVLGIMLRRQPDLARARRFDQPRRAVISGSHKLIQTGNDHVELYDLDADPRETVDLAAILPERVEELQERLSAFVRRISASAPSIRRAEGVDDPAVQRRLKELGYLE
ncbi:sulfatase [Roseiflexus sp.]|uniref:sulfatase family protein n=1 Tax=Roseiflexus sp. TaxID=2562120 RepID=UPI0021DC5014|nr:sulfatase [Roseiflexus sp.]GIV98708.1 MAG: sulfatase [Roseiflexus sp.]